MKPMETDIAKFAKEEKAEKNTPEWRENIRKHQEHYKEVQRLGIKEACRQGVLKKVSVSFSCGKDSLASLIWAKENLADIEGVELEGNYAHTPLENDLLLEYIKYVEGKVGIKINIIEFTEEEKQTQLKELVRLTKTMGPPFNQRLCTGLIKGPLFERLNENCDINLIGVRWKESFNRRNVSKLFRQSFKIYYHPIVSKSRIDIYNYVKERKIKLYFTYKYTDRLGCPMCPLGLAKKTPKEMYHIINYPEMVDWDFYGPWYEAMSKYKFTESGLSMVKRHNLLTSNYRLLKEQIRLGSKYKLTENGVPAYGFFYPEEIIKRENRAE